MQGYESSIRYVRNRKLITDRFLITATTALVVGRLISPLSLPRLSQPTTEEPRLSLGVMIIVWLFGILAAKTSHYMLL